MKTIKRAGIQFIIIIACLILITIFKPEITGYITLNTAAVSYNSVMTILTLVAILLVGIMAVKPIYHSVTIPKKDISDLSRLRDYVTETRKKGYSEEEIKEALKDYQWSGPMVDYVLENSKFI